MLAALGVFGTGTGWPDIVVAVFMGILGITAARSVISYAVNELKEAAAATVHRRGETAVVQLKRR
jgi:Co/Zn/Cd efflux system component